MSVDILGTSWYQCQSMVQYSFTSTETRKLVRTDSPGRPPRLSHSSWSMLQISTNKSPHITQTHLSTTEGLTGGGMAETQIMHDSQRQNNQYNGVMTVATPGIKRNNFKGQVSGFALISPVTHAGDTESSLRQLVSSPVSEKCVEKTLPVRFSSRWYQCAQKSPYALQPVSQVFSQRCL